ncbi:MAG TPA: hypothetical protein VL117_12830 [Thermoleophilia bacterium]|nr:hypothetical protein [Thermoleophilia bacterium]
MPSLLAAAAAAVVAVALVLAWRRLFLGVDLTDEGFTVAVPYRFALGARPFVDEMNVLQTAALFSFPFVKLYVALRGATGIVLFMRHLYLAWTVLVAMVAFAGLRRVVRWEHALLACCVCVTFVIATMSDLSYNTVAAGLLVIAMGLGARALVASGGERWLAGAGAAQALAALAYPSLVLVLPVTAVCLALAAPRRRRALGAFAAGALATLAAEALLLASFGLGNVARCVRYQLADWHRLNGGGGLTKLSAVVHGAVGHLALYPLIVAAALAIYVAYRRFPLARLALVLAPLGLLPFGEQLVSGGDGFAVIYGLAAPLFFLFVPEEQRGTATTLLVWGYLPSLAAGLITGYSSASGWLQMDVGLLPAMVLSGIFLALALAPRAGEPAAVRRALPALALACLAGMLAVTLVYDYQFLPRAVPYSKLTVTLHGGPYAGIRATPARAAYLQVLRADLPRVAASSDRLLIFYQAPAFYLFWPHGVATNSVWISSVKGLDVNYDPGPLPPATRAYYARQGVVPDVVVRVINTAGLSPAELQARYSGGLPYRLVLIRSQYVVFRRPGAAAGVADGRRPSRAAPGTRRSAS